MYMCVTGRLISLIAPIVLASVMGLTESFWGLYFFKIMKEVAGY